MNASINVFRFSKNIKLAMRPGASTFLLALLQREETCSLKLSFESKIIPRKVYFLLAVIEVSPIDILIGVVEIVLNVIVFEQVKRFA